MNWPALTIALCSLFFVTAEATTFVPSLHKGESYDDVWVSLLKAGWEPMSLVPAGKCGIDPDQCPKVPEVISCTGVGAVAP